MDIFLSRLSDLTTQSQLESTALSILARKFHLPFTDSPVLSSCKIMEIRDEHGGVECHGLLRIQPDSAGSWFLTHCNGKKIHKKSLRAHQYVIRDSSWKPSYPPEADHRRELLQVRYIKNLQPTLVTEGIDSFRKEH